MYNRVGAASCSLLSLCLFAAACSDAGSTSSSEVATTAGGVTTSEADATTSTAAVVAPTTTAPDPSIFNPLSVADPLELASFVFTTDEFHSFNGQPNARTTTSGYIQAPNDKEPNSGYIVSDFHDGTGMQEYFVDGRTYQNDNQGYWYLYESGSLASPRLDTHLGLSPAMSGVMSAVFAGSEDFAGVAAYHYTFDETNLQVFSSYTPENPSPEVEGDFFLAQEGNYVLYAHSRQVAAGAGYELIDEFTDTMSSVNALAQITLPADMQPLKDALDMGLTFGIPMLPDATLDSMINYNEGGIGVYYYQYTTTWKNETEFIDFYTNLQPTNGWTVTHIGQVKDLDAYCIDGNCVMLKNGDKQFILYFDGSNLHADYDREHRFVAQ